MLNAKINEAINYLGFRKKTFLICFFISFILLLLPVFFFLPTYETRVAIQLGQIAKFSATGGVLVSEGSQTTVSVYDLEKEILKTYGETKNSDAYVRHVENLSPYSMEVYFVSDSIEKVRALAKEVTEKYLNEDQKKVEEFRSSFDGLLSDIKITKKRFNETLKKVTQSKDQSTQKALLEVSLMREMRLLNAEEVAMQLAISNRYTHAARIIGNPSFEVKNTGGNIALRIFSALLLAFSISLFVLFLIDLLIYSKSGQLKQQTVS